MNGQKGFIQRRLLNGAQNKKATCSGGLFHLLLVLDFLVLGTCDLSCVSWAVAKYQ
jgi:hypothetical protein